MRTNLSLTAPLIRDMDCGLASLIAQNRIFAHIEGGNIMDFHDKDVTISIAPQLVAPNDWNGIKEWVLRISFPLETQRGPFPLEKLKYINNAIVVYALVWLKNKPHIVFEYANIATPPIIRPVNTANWNSTDWREAAKVNNQLRHFFVNGRDSRGLHSPEREDIKNALHTFEVAEKQGTSQEEIAEDVGYSVRHLRRLKRKHPGLNKNR